MTIEYIEENLQHNQTDYELDEVVVKSLWTMEDSHFWHKVRNQWILKSLKYYNILPPSSIFEIGCGSGVVVKKLFNAGYNTTGIDTAEILIQKADSRCPNSKFVIANIKNLPNSFHGPYDVIAFFDVLEHLDDPKNFVRISMNFLKPGGCLIATVPALKSEFTIIDQLIGHKKRYDPGELTKLFTELGFSLVIEHGIFRSISLFQKLFKRLLDKKGKQLAKTTAEYRREILLKNFQVPAYLINKLFEIICKAEILFLFKYAVNKKGLSNLTVAFKNKDIFVI